MPEAISTLKLDREGRRALEAGGRYVIAAGAGVVVELDDYDVIVRGPAPESSVSYRYHEVWREPVDIGVRALEVVGLDQELRDLVMPRLVIAMRCAAQRAGSGPR